MLRVLLVDDEPRVARALAYALAGEEVEIQSIGSARELEGLDATAPPDAVLLDVALGGDNGLAVCRDLRADERFKGVPVLLLSGQTDAATKRAGFDAGADDFISKPFVPEELLARIQSHVRRRTS